MCFPFQGIKRFSFARFSVYANASVYKGHLSEKCKPLASVWFYLGLNQRARGILRCPAVVMVWHSCCCRDCGRLWKSQMPGALAQSEQDCSEQKTNIEWLHIVLVIACILNFLLSFCISLKKGTVKNVWCCVSSSNWLQEVLSGMAVVSTQTQQTYLRYLITRL